MTQIAGETTGPRPPWYRRLRIPLRKYTRNEWMNFGCTYDARIYSTIVAVGLPLLAVLVQNTHAKVAIACVWFAIGPVLYFWLEGMEINGQIAKYGLLQQQKSDYQRKTMNDLYYGAATAFGAWLLVDAITVAVALANSWYSQSFTSIVATVVASPWVTPLRYGIVEWAILIHTFIVGKLTIAVYYPLMTNFLQATAGQRRLEERV